ncbi:MAG: tetratricopeptide repeat protein [Bacteroidia bacterium]
MFLLLGSVNAKAQAKDKDWLLVDGINYNGLHPVIKRSLDSTLALYHKASHDSTRLRILHDFIEHCTDDAVWPKYNDYMLAMARNGDSKVYLVYQAAALNNIGYAADNQGNVKKAIEYYSLGLKLREKAGDKKGIAESTNNLGALYSYQNDYAAALKCYEKSVALYEEIGETANSAQSLNNLGSAYNNFGDYQKSIEYNSKALAIQEKFKDEWGMVNSFGNLGAAYEKKGDTTKAIDYYKKGLKYSEKLGHTAGMAESNFNLGDLYYYINLKTAQEYGERSFELAQSLGFPKDIENASDLLYRIYKKTNNPTGALEMYEIAVKMRDSTNGIELVREAASSKYEWQEQQLKLEHEKETAVSAAEIKKQKLFLLLIFSIAIAVLVIAVLVFRNMQRYKKAKQAIEIQRNLAMEKQKEILDSIRYAKRIQDAVLKEQEHISTHLPEHFVMYEPKDIVSGDFYWSLEKDSYWYLAAADCTGHGVPGAFLTILGTSFLNELNAADSVLTPAEILDKLRSRIISELSATNNGMNETKDGMDISLARLNLKTNELMWAGANNPLWILSKEKGEFTVVPSHKQPIGYYPTITAYPNHSFQLSKGDTFYLFTDGYADQFGGEKGKKFKYKKLQELLFAVKNETLERQKEQLVKTFVEWRGSYEQTDDVCIVGVRL